MRLRDNTSSDTKLGPVTEAAMVSAGDIAPFEFADNVKFFAAIYGDLDTVAGAPSSTTTARCPVKF